jgi:GDP-4-dehydro-6-deoxy-D-mannose reductase
MRTLVTGAGGFAGSHLIELLEEGDNEIVGWLRPGTEPLLRGRRTRWMTVELLDREAVRTAVAELQPEAVYHLAGMPHVGDSWSHVHETFAGNALSTHYLFDGLRQAGLSPRVLVTSSATVYAPQPRAITESDPVNPNTPYGTSKLAQEMLARRAWEDERLPAVIARSFNHVGPRQTPAFVAPSIAKQIAEIEAGRREAVIEMGNLSPERDIMDVRDTVRAYRAMLESATPGAPYNVCSGVPIRISTLVDAFMDKARVPITIRRVQSRVRAVDTPMVLGDPGRLYADTGWAPQIPIDRTIDDLLAYWRSRT